MKCPIVPVLLGSLSLAGSLAQAQVQPDAGALRQQIEQGREPAIPRQTMPSIAAEPSATPPAKSSLQVKVTRFRFVGNTLLDETRLQNTLADFMNRTLDYNQLQNAAAAVAETYRQAGWVVRAFLPEQNIVDGQVTIQIVEAIFGGVRVEGESAARVSAAQVQAIVDAQQRVGKPLNADALDRALLLGDDLPGVAVSGSLREGARATETDLVLRFTNEPLLTGDVVLDNTGNRSTGETRVTGNLNLNSALGVGDLLSANLIHSEGSDYLRLGATVPMGYDGWRVGANASTMAYHLVQSDFSALNAKGSSDSFGLEASYPLIRSRLQNLYFNANTDHKAYDNKANGVTTSHYESNSITLGAWGNRFDSYWGGGANNVGLYYTMGQLDLNGSPNKIVDATSTRAAGNYSKLRFNASRQQIINTAVSLYGAVSGQWTDKNLDSSEKFYLGGANGVRAYPTNEAGGALGQLLNLEVRWRLPQGFNASAFYDVGTVTGNKDNSFAGAPAVNDITLKGNGLSLSWLGGSGVNVKGIWARRIGSNPAASAQGNDQDGSKVLDRWWLIASLPF